MGGAKPLRRLGGERLIDRALRLARRWSDDVRVALREPGQLGDVAAAVLFDDPAIEGPLGGLAAALAAARDAGRETLLAVPCDTPFLPVDLAGRLRAAIGAHGAALAASGDDLHPACALWRADALARLGDYAASGRRSLIGFAEAIGYVAVRWEARCLVNLNSPADLAEAERRLASEGEGVDPGTGRDWLASRR